MKPTHRFVATAVAFVVGIGIASAPPTSDQAFAADPPVSYRLDVKPILDSRCIECHSPGGSGLQKSGFDMTSYQGLMAGTKYGPMIVPGDPTASNLLRLIEGKAAPELRMPHNQRPLLSSQIDILRAWIKQGAKDN